MQQRKNQFSKEVEHTVSQVCKLVFNLKSNDEITRVFGITNEKMSMVIHKIIIALPDDIFNVATQKLEEVKNIIANEFIFFQVQEKGNEAQYEEDLLRFIAVFCRDIERRVKGNKDTLNVGEE